MTEQQLSYSEQQIKAGNQIIANYKVNCRWNILIAQPQSGKSNTYCFTIAEMIRQNIIDSAIIFSGNVETELKQQTIKSTKDFSFYNKYLKNVFQMNDDDSNALINKIINNIDVIWGYELVKKHTHKNNTNVLYVLDESHATQNKNMRTDKFLKSIDISANGNNQLLEEKNNYFLSVSATPFSEISDNIQFNQSKKVVNLELGNGYYGLKNMMDNNQINGFDYWQDGLIDALQTPGINNKYAIVRITKKKEAEAKQIIYNNGWNYINYNSGSIKNGKSTIKSLDELTFEPLHLLTFQTPIKH